MIVLLSIKVCLETYTGLLVYSEQREEEKLVRLHGVYGDSFSDIHPVPLDETFD